MILSAAAIAVIADFTLFWRKQGIRRKTKANGLSGNEKIVYVENFEEKMQKLRDSGLVGEDFEQYLQQEGGELTFGECSFVLSTAREIIHSSETESLFNEVQDL